MNFCMSHIVKGWHDFNRVQLMESEDFRSIDQWARVAGLTRAPHQHVFETVQCSYISFIQNIIYFEESLLMLVYPTLQKHSIKNAMKQEREKNAWNLGTEYAMHK